LIQAANYTICLVHNLLKINKNREKLSVKKNQGASQSGGNWKLGWLQQAQG